MLYIIIIVSLVGFWAITKYFYDKLDRHSRSSVSELNNTLSEILPLLNQIVNTNIPVENSYDPNHSLDSDRLYDDSIDRKILGDKYPASEIKKLPILINSENEEE